MTSPENSEEMIKQTSQKRKRTYNSDGYDLPAAKRPRMMTWASKRLEQRSWEWCERRRKIDLGVALYWEARVRDARRMARKRASSEMFADYIGMVKSKYMKLLQDTLVPPKPASSLSSSILAISEASEETTTKAALNEVTASAPKRRVIKKLLDNAEAKEAPGVKVTPAPRRNGWRRKGEKRT